MPAIQIHNAGSLASFFDDLAEDQKDQFLVALGRRCGPSMLIKAYTGMNAVQQETFVSYVLTNVAADVFPLVVREAVRTAKEHIANPDVDRDKEFEAKTNEYVGRLIETQREKVKAKRDRKPSPETVQQNREIIRLRKEDKKLWSNRNLAEKFDVDESYIRKVLKEQEKWLASTD